MIVIGVTGGVGTGKSTVSRMLRDRGAVLIDADEIAHRVILPDGPAYAGLVKAFGPGIVAPDGTINRRELGRRAFADAAGARLVESIIHPAVIEVVRGRLAEAAAAGAGAAVIDVPLLYESGLDQLCGQVWVVTADPAVQRERVSAREGAAAGEVLARERWQVPMAEKTARADAVIDNSGDRAHTADQVARLVSRLWPGPPA